MKLGEKMPGKVGNVTAVEPPPVIHLSSKDLPDIKNWKPGNKYRIVLDVEQMNMSLGGDIYREQGKPDDTVRASFRVISARPQYGGGSFNKKNGSSNKPNKSVTMEALSRKSKNY